MVEEKYLHKRKGIEKKADDEWFVGKLIRCF
jgi:hypothetical protein